MWTRIIAGAGSLLLALALAWAYGNARYGQGKSDEAGKWRTKVAEQAGQIAELRAADDGRVTQSATNYVRTLERLQPIIIQSKQEVADYAQTPSGAVICLDAIRVHGIDTHAAALGLRPATATANGNPALPTVADSPQP